jgi:6-phosphogluconolactonase
VLAATLSGDVGNHPGEIVTSGDGSFVYLGNRGANTVGVFATFDDGATLTPQASPDCGGDWPRHLTLDEENAWLYVANQRSGTITWLPIAGETGIPGLVSDSLAVPGAAQLLLA